MNDLDDVFAPIPVKAGEIEKLTNLLNDRSVVEGTSNGHASASAKLQQSFISQNPEGSQNCVGIHAKHGREILGWR